MKTLRNKKTALICVFAAILLVSILFFALTLSGKKAYAEKSGYVLIDADKFSFADDTTIKPSKDTLNLFNKGNNNNIIQIALSDTNSSAKLKVPYLDMIYGGYSDAISVEVRVMFNRWPNRGYGGFSENATYVSFSIFNSADTSFEDPIVTVRESGTGKDFAANYLYTLQLSPEKVCNTYGKVSDFILKVDSDATSWLSSVMVDYVKIVFSIDYSISCAGDCIVSEKPASITDDNVVWTAAESYSNKYTDATLYANSNIDFNNYGGLYSYVSNSAFVELSEEKFNDYFDSYIESYDSGTNVPIKTLLAKNVVFAFDVRGIKASDYKQFLMDILLNDKKGLGGHKLYLYGSDTEKFVDENGNPVGYASEVIVQDNEQGFHNKFILEGDEINKLADSNGYVSKIYVLYNGNTLDTANNIVGLRNGSHIWVNKIQFLKESEVEEPEIVDGNKYEDISDVFPVGESVTINNPASKIGDVVSNAALKNINVNGLSFKLNMASGDNVCFLFNAKGRNKVNEYLTGGILFSLSEGKLEISAHYNGTATKSFSAVTNTSFSGGKSVKLQCVPYTLDTIQSGYYCAIIVDGEKYVDGYFRNDMINVGNSLHLGYVAKGESFSVTLSSSKTENITSSSKVMDVKVSAEKVLHTLDKTDIPLVLYWYDTGFDELSELKCDDNFVSINQESKRIVFNDNGEAKVSFSVTNAFGTFNSEELSVKCDDVVIQNSSEDQEVPIWLKLLYFAPILPVTGFGVYWTVSAIKKKKIAKLVK